MKNFVQKTRLLFAFFFMVLVALIAPISVYACNTTPTPTPIPSPTLTPTPIPSPTLTPTPIPSPTLTPTPMPTLTPTPEPSVTPTITPTPIPENPVKKITITKTNDKTGGVGAGDYVTYTLTLTNEGNANFSSIEVVDVLPGFWYVTGSSKINSVSSNDPSEWSGRLTWNLGNLNASQTVKIEYRVQVPGDTDSATYTNIATCMAKVSDSESIGCNVVKSNVPVGTDLVFSANVGTTRVLGTSTSVLPATGDNPYYLFTSFTMFATGALVKLIALVFKKEEEYEYA